MKSLELRNAENLDFSTSRTYYDLKIGVICLPVD